MAKLQGGDQLNARLEAMGQTSALLREIQLRTIREAKLRVHRRTGHLGRSIVPGPVDRDSVIIEARTPYAAAEELGRRKVTIRPKKAKVLAWGGTRRLSGALRRGASATNFASVVNQPARKGHPYLVPAVQKAVKDLTGAVVRLWNRAA